MTWTVKLPVGPMVDIWQGMLSTDATNHVFVASTADVGAPQPPAIRRINASDGTIDWVAPITPCEATGQPVLLANGRADLFVYGGATPQELLSFSDADGTSTSFTPGLTHLNGLSSFAVGAEGSLYLIDGRVEPSHLADYVVRVAPDGTIAWRSVDLDTLGVPPGDGYVGIGTSEVVLASGDLVVVGHDVHTNAGNAIVLSAFDPANGTALWSKATTGQRVGGPVSRPDGTIVALVANDAWSDTSLLQLAAKDGTVTAYSTPPASGIFGVTRSGIVLVGVQNRDGLGGVRALASDGSVVWTQPGALDVTIASNGLLIARWGTADGGARSIVALDETTGAKVWELDPRGPAIEYVALTSAGGIVAEQADGTLFGASD